MDIGEGALVANILTHDAADCPFCKGDDDVEHDDESEDDADADEDADDADLINNDAGKLERNMKRNGSPRPASWKLELDIMKGKKRAKEKQKITPNPHHIIPGNEALKESQDLLEWIFKAKGRISRDIGYTVNSEENGVWLPSNNSMRGDARWDDEDFKVDYARKAMTEAGGHFHDRHVNPYSNFVVGILNKIVDRMSADAADADCPFKASTEADDDGLMPPPYALIPRLNGVSERLRGHLTDLDDLTPFIYTSRLVLEVWEADGNDAPVSV